MARAEVCRDFVRERERDCVCVCVCVFFFFLRGRLIEGKHKGAKNERQMALRQAKGKKKKTERKIGLDSSN